MTPIEQTSDGMLVFLNCGCAALRWRSHPTGAAVLVQITQACDEHIGYDENIGGVPIRSVPKGHLVSPYVRTLVTLDSIDGR